MSEVENNPKDQKLKLSKLAIWSMVFGILGFLSQCFSLIPVFLCGSGLVFSIIALRKITKSDSLLVGRGFAVAGLLISASGFFVPTLKLVHCIQFFRQAQVTKIDNVASKTTLTLSIENNSNIVDGISILVTGHIDGSATVHIGDGDVDVDYPKYNIKGMVCLIIEDDWYTGKCRLEYEPVDVHSGYLTIRYVLWERDW